MFGCPLDEAWATPVHMQQTLNTMRQNVDKIWEQEAQALDEFERDHQPTAPMGPRVPPQYRGYLADGSFQGEQYETPIKKELRKQMPMEKKSEQDDVKEGFEPAPINALTLQYAQWFDCGVLFILGCLLILIFEHILNMGIHFQRVL